MWLWASRRVLLALILWIIGAGSSSEAGLASKGLSAYPPECAWELDGLGEERLPPAVERALSTFDKLSSAVDKGRLTRALLALELDWEWDNSTKTVRGWGRQRRFAIDFKPHPTRHFQNSIRLWSGLSRFDRYQHLTSVMGRAWALAEAARGWGAELEKGVKVVVEGKEFDIYGEVPFQWDKSMPLALWMLWILKQEPGWDYKGRVADLARRYSRYQNSIWTKKGNYRVRADLIEMRRNRQIEKAPEWLRQGAALDFLTRD